VSRSPLPYRAYGATGDYAGARRNRRAFQLGVVLVAALTFALWFSENFLRYDLLESQYLSALSLHPESARPIMRRVVRSDTEQNEVPSARYVEALAEIEEPGFELQRFEQAYLLDPANSILIMKYGCQLFKNKQYREARERFREAGVQPPKNALPRYLEAAALAAASRPDESLADAIALLARTNNTHDPVIYPKPLWHVSLPRDGALYAQKRRELVDEVLEPLFQFGNLLERRAERAMDEATIQEWDVWLEKFEEMGARLAGNPTAPEEEIGVSQILAGIHFQLQALRLRNEISRQVQDTDLPGVNERMARLNTARETLIGAEDVRVAQLRSAEGAYTRPISLLWRGFACFFGMLVLVGIASRLGGAERALWTIPQPRMVYLVLGLCMLNFLLILLTFNYLIPEPGSLSFQITVAGWWGNCALLVLFGLAYPPMTLRPQPEWEQPREDDGESSEDTMTPPEGKWRPCLAMSRRYFGTLIGVYFVTICLWFVFFRLTNQVYPSQLELLAPGFREMEVEAVRQVQAMLQNSVR